MRREGKVELDVKVSVRNKHVFYRVKTGLSAGNQLVSDFLIFSLQTIRLRLRDITIEAENSLVAASCVSYYVSQCVPMCLCERPCFCLATRENSPSRGGVSSGCAAPPEPEPVLVVAQ